MQTGSSETGREPWEDEGRKRPETGVAKRTTSIQYQEMLSQELSSWSRHSGADVAQTLRRGHHYCRSCLVGDLEANVSR